MINLIAEASPAPYEMPAIQVVYWFVVPIVWLIGFTVTHVQYPELDFEDQCFAAAFCVMIGGLWPLVLLMLVISLPVCLVFLLSKRLATVIRERLNPEERQVRR